MGCGASSVADGAAAPIASSKIAAVVAASPSTPGKDHGGAGTGTVSVAVVTTENNHVSDPCTEATAATTPVTTRTTRAAAPTPSGDRDRDVGGAGGVGATETSTPRTPRTPVESMRGPGIVPPLARADSASMACAGGGGGNGVDTARPPFVSRQSSSADVALTLLRTHTTPVSAPSQQAEGGGAAATAVHVGPSGPGAHRSKTFGRRASHGGGLLSPAGEEQQSWRSPRHAADLIAAQLAEDPQAFRDHLALYWRLENMPPPAPAPPAPVPSHPIGIAGASRLAQPTPRRDSASVVPESGRLQLHPAAHASAPPTATSSPVVGDSPGPGVSASPPPSAPSPSQVAEQITVFLSLGPSSGAGDKIGSSEPRALERSVSFHPMLLPYHGLNGGDPSFSIQVQVWQRRAPAHAAHTAPPPASLTLLGYVDVSVLHMFSSFEKGQGLLLKAAPQSALPAGVLPVALQGAMLIVDYIQFYCHTTPAVLYQGAGIPHAGRWPRQLASPQSDCLWRAQLQAIKLAPPRGCPHPNVIGGSMSPAIGALSMLNAGMGGGPLASLGAPPSAPGVCFFQIFKGVYAPGTAPPPGTGAAPAVPAATAASASESGAAPGLRQPQSSPSLTNLHTGSPALAPSANPSNGTGGVSALPPPASWSLVHTSEFVPLSRYPKFSEFQRPIADICEGSYVDLPLLLQLCLTHDNPSPGALGRLMPAGTLTSDPASTLQTALRSLGMAACSVVQTQSHMRGLLAGKTKLRLHAPGACTGLELDPLTRANTFTLTEGAAGGPASGSIVSAAAAAAAAAEDQFGSLGTAGGGGGHSGTIAFNVSQIYTSRASLEALARQKLAAAAASAGKAPGESDGFDEAGVVRSTALLASLLPLGTRRHHRPGSHMRGPSAMVGGGGGGGDSPHGLTSGMGAEAAIALRSKSIAAASSWSPAHSSGSGAGAGCSPSNGPAAAEDSLLQKMGIASGPPPMHSGGGGGSRRGSIKQQYSSSNSGAPVQQAISPKSFGSSTIGARRSSQ